MAKVSSPAPPSPLRSTWSTSRGLGAAELARAGDRHRADGPPGHAERRVRPAVEGDAEPHTSLSNRANVVQAVQTRSLHGPQLKADYLRKDALKDALGSDSKRLLLVNISPREDCSLRFPAKVKTTSFGKAGKASPIMTPGRRSLYFWCLFLAQIIIHSIRYLFTSICEPCEP